MLFVACPQGR